MPRMYRSATTSHVNYAPSSALPNKPKATFTEGDMPEIDDVKEDQPTRSSLPPSLEEAQSAPSAIGSGGVPRGRLAKQGGAKNLANANEAPIKKQNSKKGPSVKKSVEEYESKVKYSDVASRGPSASVDDKKSKSNSPTKKKKFFDFGHKKNASGKILVPSSSPSGPRDNSLERKASQFKDVGDVSGSELERIMTQMEDQVIGAKRMNSQGHHAASSKSPRTMKIGAAKPDTPASKPAFLSPMPVIKRTSSVAVDEPGTLEDMIQTLDHLINNRPDDLNTLWDSLEKILEGLKGLSSVSSKLRTEQLEKAMVAEVLDLKGLNAPAPTQESNIFAKWLSRSIFLYFDCVSQCNSALRCSYT
jgi:hypothetical protein